MTSIDTDTNASCQLDASPERDAPERDNDEPLIVAADERDEDVAEEDLADDDGDQDDDFDDDSDDEDSDGEDDEDVVPEDSDEDDSDEDDGDDDDADGDESDEDADEDASVNGVNEAAVVPVMPESVAEQVAEQDANRQQRMAEDLRVLEALLFASAEPVPERAMSERLGEGADIPALLEDLKRYYEGRGVELLQANGRWSFRTAPDVTERLRLEKLVPRKLSRAAIETLAIVAYHQPVTRAEIEEIRGVVVSTGTVDILLEEGWIKPRGRKQVPGRPVMWGTSNAFLDHFGLESIQDLPGIDELRAAGLLDSRGVSAYATRGGETMLFDTEESDEALEPLTGGDDGADAAEAPEGDDKNA